MMFWTQKNQDLNEFLNVFCGAFFSLDENESSLEQSPAPWGTCMGDSLESSAFEITRLEA